MSGSFSAHIRAFASQRPRLMLAMLALATFALIFPGDNDSSDTTRRLQVTHWIWQHAPQVDLEGDPTLIAIGRDGQPQAIYGIGQSILMLPGDVLAQTVMRELAPHIASPVLRGKTLSFLEAFPTFAALDAIAVVLSYDLLVAIGFSSAVALPATLLFMVGSTFLVYMQTAQENSQMYLCFVGALLFGIRAVQTGRAAGLVLAGAFVGFSILIKVTDFAFAPGMALVFTVLRARRRAEDRPRVHWMGAGLEASWYVARYFGPPIVLGLILDRLYQSYRFGNFTGSYMSALVQHFAQLGGYPPGFPMGYDRIAGFLGPFVSPDKSFLIFEPVLWFLIAALCLAWRRIELPPKLVIGCGFLSLLLVAIGISNFYWWRGDSAWGPRHHLVAVELMSLVAFAILVQLFARLRLGLKVLVAANLFIAITVQVMALPIPDLETGQNLSGDPLRIVPLMRIRNLYHIAIKDFSEKGLDYGEPALARQAEKDTERHLFVFRLGPYVPAGLQYTLIALWGVLLGATVGTAAPIVIGGLFGKRDDKSCLG